MKKVILLVAVSAILSACAGSGGSSPATNNNGNTTQNQPPSNTQPTVNLNAACSTIDACARQCIMTTWYLTTSQIASLNGQYNLADAYDYVFATANNNNQTAYQNCLTSKASSILPSTDISAPTCDNNSSCQANCKSKYPFQDPKTLITAYANYPNGGSLSSLAIGAYYSNFLMEVSYNACINSPATEI